jgi:hypothetical protein
MAFARLVTVPDKQFNIREVFIEPHGYQQLL